jgi:hypothetical protein
MTAAMERMNSARTHPCTMARRPPEEGARSGTYISDFKRQWEFWLHTGVSERGLGLENLLPGNLLNVCNTALGNAELGEQKFGGLGGLLASGRADGRSALHAGAME